MSGEVVYSPNPEKSKAASRTANKWNPKELSPMMKRIMDLQLFNPSIKVKEIAQIVKWSPNRVKRIISSDMYRTRYQERIREVEQLQHSMVARERAKFEKLRDQMIDEHLKIINLDPAKYGGKELELEKVRQKSVQDLLRVSNEQLKSAGDNGGKGDSEERTRSVEISGNADESYMRIMETWRKGTK